MQECKIVELTTATVKEHDDGSLISADLLKGINDSPECEVCNLRCIVYQDGQGVYRVRQEGEPKCSEGRRKISIVIE